MRPLRITALILLFPALVGFRVAGQSQLSPDQAAFLESARRSALAYSSRLPDFICTQITHRQTSLLDVSEVAPPDLLLRSTGSWSRKPTEHNDEIRERLTYFGQKESYQVIDIDGKEAIGFDHLQLQGAISVGEFGTDLRRVFAPESETVFTWDRIADLHGRRIYIFRFTVPKKSGTIVDDRESGRKVVVSYSGEIYIDPSTFEVLRITAHLDMPPDFPIRAGDRMVEYKPIDIGGKSYNLPFHAEVRMRDAQYAFVNRIDFTDYHKFAAESTIHYGDQAPE